MSLTADRLVEAYLAVKVDLKRGRKGVEEMTAEQYAGLLIRTAGSPTLALRLIETAPVNLETAYPGVTRLLKEVIP